MNKHYLLAIAITPMLLIAGYMAAGHFFAKSNDQTLYELAVNDDCSLTIDSHCVLTSGELTITLTIKEDQIISLSSHELVKVSIGLEGQTLPMQKGESSKQWLVRGDMNKLPMSKLRYVAQSEAGYFIAEITP